MLLLSIYTNKFDNHASVHYYLSQEVMFLPLFVYLSVCLSVCLFVCLFVCLQDIAKTIGPLYIFRGCSCFLYIFPHWLFHIYPLFYRYCFYSSRIFVTFHCTEYLKKHTINVNEMQVIISLEVMLKQGMDVHCFVWIW